MGWLVQSKFHTLRWLGPRKDYLKKVLIVLLSVIYLQVKRTNKSIVYSVIYMFLYHKEEVNKI